MDSLFTPQQSASEYSIESFTQTAATANYDISDSTQIDAESLDIDQRSVSPDSPLLSTRVPRYAINQYSDDDIDLSRVKKKCKTGSIEYNIDSDSSSESRQINNISSFQNDSEYSIQSNSENIPEKVNESEMKENVESFIITTSPIYSIDDTLSCKSTVVNLGESDDEEDADDIKSSDGYMISECSSKSKSSDSRWIKITPDKYISPLTPPLKKFSRNGFVDALKLAVNKEKTSHSLWKYHLKMNDLQKSRIQMKVISIQVSRSTDVQIVKAIIIRGCIDDVGPSNEITILLDKKRKLIYKNIFIYPPWNRLKTALGNLVVFVFHYDKVDCELLKEDKDDICNSLKVIRLAGWP